MYIDLSTIELDEQLRLEYTQLEYIETRILKFKECSIKM